MDKETIIILAAGSSSRLGQSKQLVEINGTPLLLKSVQAALEAKYNHILLVIGANADAHKKVVAHLPIEIITNDDWEKGMGSSLKKGLHHVINTRPQTNAVTIMVCDQVMISSHHLKSILTTYRETSKSVVVSKYANTIGVPALFARSLFDELLQIKDNQGAKVVIEQHLNQSVVIDWPEGSLDIDTPEDLKKIK